MYREPLTKYDGFIALIGGQDSGRSPSLLDPTQCAQLVNCTVRGGLVRPRPGFTKFTFSFPTDEIETWFTTKTVQGVISFRPRSKYTVQVWSVGGRFFTVDILNSNEVQEITPTSQTPTTANFTVPAIGSSVTIDVTDADKIPVGYPVRINGLEYQVTAKTGMTITVTNVGGTPAAVIASGAIVTFLDVNGQNAGICWMIQAEDFLIVQDGFSRPLIFDGAVSRRSNTEQQEVPTGTVMAYGIGRLWVATTAREFVAGDIVGGPTGTEDYNFRDAILKFTENTFLAEGGAFSAPDDITAMQFATVLDTSTGQGPLLVFTESSVLSINAPSDRTLWKAVTNPIQTISLISSGAKGFYNTVSTVNGDIFFRAKDGLRSFFVALRMFGDWGNTPISTEMDNILNDDAEELLKYGSAIVFDNRLLMTAANRPTAFGVYHKCMVALDFHTISSMREKLPPVYDGIWTGIDPTWLFKGTFNGKERAFAAVRNVDGENELWEISKTNKFDNTAGRIRWKVVTKNFNFGNPMTMNRLESAEIWMDQVVGEVDITLEYRPDEYPCWYAWREASVCADYRVCDGFTDCEFPPHWNPGYKTRINFGQPPDRDETNDGKPARLGYEFQFKIDIEGYAELKKFRSKAIEVVEDVYPKIT